MASDGIYARMGSLSADEERFMAWRTIDGKERDPLGQFGELETLVRGVFNKEHLLDYLRHFKSCNLAEKRKLHDVKKAG